MNFSDRDRKRRVRAIARESSPASEELFKRAAGQRKEWTLAEWDDVLHSLDTCDDRLEDWLSLRE